MDEPLPPNPNCWPELSWTFVLSTSEDLDTADREAVHTCSPYPQPCHMRVFKKTPWHCLKGRKLHAHDLVHGLGSSRHTCLESPLSLFRGQTFERERGVGGHLEQLGRTAGVCAELLRLVAATARGRWGQDYIGYASACHPCAVPLHLVPWSQITTPWTTE